MQKGDPMNLILKFLKYKNEYICNIPTEIVQRIYDKNGVICQSIMFTPRVMVVKIAKMAHFLYFLLTPRKNQSQLGQNI